MFFFKESMFKKQQQNRTRLKTKFQYPISILLFLSICEQTRSRGHKTDFHSFANAHAKLQK